MKPKKKGLCRRCEEGAIALYNQTGLCNDCSRDVQKNSTEEKRFYASFTVGNVKTMKDLIHG